VSAALIEAAAADGVRLALSADGTLKTIGPAEAVRRWVPRLKPHKPEIIELLRVPTARATRSNAWLLHYADRESMEVWFAPAVDRGEALAAYPDAVAAEPVPEYSARACEPDCSTCRHRKRPGLSAPGYCSGRDDLPGAYGEHHPLRRPPDDNGASCASYHPIEE
jgi:hypothetical protein